MNSRVQAQFLVAIAGLALGLTTLPGDFIFDDIDIVQRNARTQELAQIPALFASSYWGPDYSRSLYRPMLLASFTVETAIFGRESALIFHLTNALLYAVICGLLVRVMLAMGASVMVAVTSGLVFAAHPIHVEATANIVGRAELGAALFVLLGLLQALRRDSSWKSAARLALCLLVAMLFKESGIVLVALAIWAQPRIFDWKAHWRSWTLMGAAFLIWMLMRSVALTGEGTPEPASMLDNILYSREPGARIAGALAVLCKYAAMTVWPWPLCADYSLAALVPPESPAAPQSLLGLFIIAFLAITIVVARACAQRAEPRARGSACLLLSMGALFWLAAILPVSNLLFPIGTVFGERLLFAPSAGLAIASAGVLELMRARATLFHVAVAALVLATLLGAIGFTLRSRDWQSERRLFAKDVLTCPDSAKIQSKLGSAIWKEAMNLEGAARQEMLQTARLHLQRGVEIFPDFYQGRINYAIVLGVLGEKELALKNAEAVYQVKPDHQPAASAYAYALIGVGRHAEAVSVCDRGLERWPRNLELHQLRLDAFLKQGDNSGVVEAFTNVLQHGGSVATADHYITQLFAAGHGELARMLIERMLSMSMPEIDAVRSSLLAKRAGLNVDRGDFAAALRDADAALQLDANFHQARAMKAEALIALGRMPEATAEIDALARIFGEEKVAPLRERARGR